MNCPAESRVQIQRPGWLPAYIPELDGLRGMAILWVVIYHCKPRLVGTWIYGAALWGWAGVVLFFALSGFLITSILLTSRGNMKTCRALVPYSSWSAKANWT